MPLLIALALIATLLGGVACAEPYTQFSYVRPWTIIKRSDGTCSAMAPGALPGDIFLLSINPKGVLLQMGNPAFQIPAGQYPIQISLRGFAIAPADESSMNAAVRPGENNWISVDLLGHEIENLPKAALLEINLAGRQHPISLGDTAAMFRGLHPVPKTPS